MNGEKRAEIYTYEAPWMIYACNWSVRIRQRRDVKEDDGDESAVGLMKEGVVVCSGRMHTRGRRSNGDRAVNCGTARVNE